MSKQLYTNYASIWPESNLKLKILDFILMASHQKLTETNTALLNKAVVLLYDGAM